MREIMMPLNMALTLASSSLAALFFVLAPAAVADMRLSIVAWILLFNAIVGFINVTIYARSG